MVHHQTLSGATCPTSLFMQQLKSVEELDSQRSHWRVALPSGLEVEWEARIIEERENELIV